MLYTGHTTSRPQKCYSLATLITAYQQADEGWFLKFWNRVPYLPNVTFCPMIWAAEIKSVRACDGDTKRCPRISLSIGRVV
jgi:hypothetical protein